MPGIPACARQATWTGWFSRKCRGYCTAGRARPSSGTRCSRTGWPGTRPAAAVCVRLRRIPARNAVARQRRASSVSTASRARSRSTATGTCSAAWSSRASQAAQPQAGRPGGCDVSLCARTRLQIRMASTLAALRHNCAPATTPVSASSAQPMVTTTELGRAAESLALARLESAGLVLLTRNYRCKAGEIDLVMLDAAAQVLVLVEVRSRSRARFRQRLGLDQLGETAPLLAGGASPAAVSTRAAQAARPLRRDRDRRARQRAASHRS